ncbi:MAG: transcriptional regulator [Herbinix sp.]|jgi:DNA-binding transcriptional ArsR family regulator|nr:transcriptional regulator [Herbinix sp.]
MNKITMPHDHGQNIENVLDNMPEISRFLEAATTFQQLCDGSRLRILWLLCHSEECVSNIAAAVSMSDAAVSHHLKTLKLNGLITSRREGKEVYYTLSHNERAQLVHQMIDDYFQLTCPTPHS